MRRDQPIERFRDQREAWQILVEPQRQAPERVAGRLHQVKHSLRRAVVSLALEILDGALEIGAGNVGKAIGGGLVRNVFDAVAGERLPVADPDPAEGTIAIEDEDGPCAEITKSIRSGAYRTSLMSAARLPSESRKNAIQSW